MVQSKKEGKEEKKKIHAVIWGSLWGAFLTFLAQIPHVAIKYCITKFLQKHRLCTQSLIETLGSMVVFDENQAVSDINKYEFLYLIYAKIVNFLVI